MVVSLQIAGEAAAKQVTVIPLSAIIQMKEKGAGYAVYSVEKREGKAVARLKRVALGPPIGDMVTVTGYHAKDQSQNMAMLKELITADGTVYGLFGPQQSPGAQ